MADHGGGGEGGGGAGGLWMYHRDGGAGIPLVSGATPGAPRQPQWPSVSRDGKYVYFFADAAQATVSGRNDVLQGSKQLYRFDRHTGAITEVTSGVSVQQHQGSSGG
ncbi:MAG TPA: hypothetical protein VNW90_07195, partial [Acetobacteraceae bacterium]|nr:hypothetical protein [Acetobacteraceae bacterium]